MTIEATYSRLGELLTVRIETQEMPAGWREPRFMAALQGIGPPGAWLVHVRIVDGQQATNGVTGDGGPEP